MKKEAIILISKSRYSFRKNCEFNRGSLAVLIVTINMLREIMPDAKIKTFIQLSRKISEKYGVEVVKRNRLNKLADFHLINSMEMSINLLICLLWKLVRRLGFNISFPKITKVLKEFVEADIILDLSLDSYGDNDPRSMWETSKEFLIAKSLGKPVICIAQSMGPFRSPLGRLLAKYVLNKVNAISVREETSYNHLIEAGVTKPSIYITADFAFLLEPVSTNVASEVLKEKFNSNCPVVGIAISKMKEFEKIRSITIKIFAHLYSLALYLLPEILIESVIHKILKKARVFKRVEAQIDFKWLIEAINYLIEKYNAIVLLIPHIISSQDELFGDDRTAIRKIYDAIEGEKRKKVIPILEDYSSEELKSIIGTCDIFIGMKMHANIAALSQCIPTIAIAYSHKFHGIMKMLGQERFVLNATNSEEVIRKMEELWVNRNEISMELKERLRDVREKALFNATLVFNLLKQSSTK
jgi:polysaccharide pyruvyl transferase WcaK-like protein